MEIKTKKFERSGVDDYDFWGQFVGSSSYQL